MAELQTKLANLILGLKTQPELDQLVHETQDSARPHAPVADSWAPPPGESWVSTTSPSRAGGGGSGSGSGGWGSPDREWGSSTRGGAGSASYGSPNANGADTAGWGGGPTSSGWQSPNPKTNTGWTR